MLERSSLKQIENDRRFIVFPRIQDAVIVPAIALLMFALGVMYGRSTMPKISPTIAHPPPHSPPLTYGRFGHL